LRQFYIEVVVLVQHVRRANWRTGCTHLLYPLRSSVAVVRRVRARPFCRRASRSSSTSYTPVALYHRAMLLSSATIDALLALFGRACCGPLLHLSFT
jgi:hypothetical protein